MTGDRAAGARATGARATGARATGDRATERLLRDFDLAHAYQGVAFGEPWQHGGTILSHLLHRARANSGEPFVTTVSADGSSVTLRYGELERLSRQVACWLAREAGLGENDVVAVIPGNDIDSIITIFGVLRCGSAVLLLSPADPVARLGPQVAAVGAKLILRGPGAPDDVFPGAIAMPQAAGLPAAADWRDRPVQPACDALIFGTSGSTAAAKLVVQSQYNVVVNAAAVRAHHDLRPGDPILGCLPIHHVNGLHFTVFAALVAGAHVMLAHAFEPFGYPRLMQRFKPKIASVVPSVLEALLDTWRTPTLPSQFGYFVSAAAPLATATAQRVWRSMGVRVLQGYGLTETTNFSTMMPPGTSPDGYRRLIAEADIPSVGVAVPGNEVAILRPDGSPASAGAVGEICMRGHNVMTRYEGNAEATAEAFEHGWFHSQDLGFEVPDGESGQRFIVITGRSKNIAKVGGQTVSLEEMERVLRTLPQVRDAACVSHPDRLYGDQIVAAVVFAPGAVADIHASLREYFSVEAMPRRVVRVEAIPRTATGKILRPQLTQALASADQGQGR